MKKLSVVLATRNEEENIGRCLSAIQSIADEIIIFDENSTDDTVKIAKGYGAKVFLEPHHDNFHITKQKAIDKAIGDWILQLDADEVVTDNLAKEINQVINSKDEEIQARLVPNLFKRHQKVLEKRNTSLYKSGEIVAFFIPRRNMFLGMPLIHAGVYPDAVIRLIKKNKARLPAKSVHEQMQVDGQVSWLVNDLLHFDSPTIKRYIQRMNRYTDLHAEDLSEHKVGRGYSQLVNYTVIRPMVTFFKLYIRHKGFIDGIRGFLWSMFSAFHFPLAYYKYMTKNN